jgi:hypothetical protein
MGRRLDVYDLAPASPHAITASTWTGSIAIESAPDLSTRTRFLPSVDAAGGS